MRGDRATVRSGRGGHLSAAPGQPPGGADVRTNRRRDAATELREIQGEGGALGVARPLQ